MTTPRSPADIARDALRLLATRRIAPTPENYQRIWLEITGDSGSDAQEGARWAETLREFAQQWERRQAGFSPARKREELERALRGSERDVTAIRTRLRQITRTWSEMPATPQSPAREEADWSLALRAQVAQLLQSGLAPRLTRFPELEREALRLAESARAVADAPAAEQLAHGIRQLLIQIELRGEDDAKVLEGLDRILHLVIENISELVLDDRWMRGQIDAVQKLLTEPLTPRQLYETERNLRDVVLRQSNLKHMQQEAQQALREMVTRLVGELGELAASTGGFGERIEACTARIEKAGDLGEISGVLQEVLSETRTLQAAMQKSRSELVTAQSRARDAEQRLESVQQELTQVSELVRQDPLTGSLNRRGLDDSLARELTRAERKQATLCLAVLDLDHFKKLNDTHGHDAGDAALVHLVRTARQTLRPTDDLARHGGEEFAIVLPDTQLDDAAEIMRRLQRNLTREIFMHKLQKLLITFSAGVAQWRAGESAAEVLARADAALYEAKRQGRNQVCVAP